MGSGPGLVGIVAGTIGRHCFLTDREDIVRAVTLPNVDLNPNIGASAKVLDWESPEIIPVSPLKGGDPSVHWNDKEKEMVLQVDHLLAADGSNSSASFAFH